MAGTLGCILGLSDSFISLTLISAGCSLPDCLISYHHAHKRSADAALTSIYATNSAALFLGLGLPWLIAACYEWSNTGTAVFTLGELPTADIAFALVLFLVMSVLVFLLLVWRRMTGIEAELGGDKVHKHLSACLLITLWLSFVTLNCLNSYTLVGDRDMFVQAVQLADIHQCNVL